MNKIFIIALFFFAFLFGSCATFISTTQQCITINSTPVGAKVIIDGKTIGEAPLFCLLKRKNIHTIRLELDGYNPYEITLSQKFNGWAIGNFIIGPYGLLGLLIDYSTGGVYKLTPNEIKASLTPKQTSILSKEGIYIDFRSNNDSNRTKIGQLTQNTDK
jgi:hypothetical protein